MVGLELDVFHVGWTGADIFGGDVAASERLDESAMCPEQRLPIRSLVVPDDDGLAATQIDSGDCGLVRHATREPEGIRDRLIGARVLPEPGAAEGWPECGIVDGDDTEVAARGIV